MRAGQPVQSKGQPVHWPELTNGGYATASAYVGLRHARGFASDRALAAAFSATCGISLEKYMFRCARNWHIVAIVAVHYHDLVFLDINSLLSYTENCDGLSIALFV